MENAVSLLPTLFAIRYSLFAQAYAFPAESLRVWFTCILQ